MPFIIIQQLHMPPAIMVQRFCIMPLAILSSLVHMIFTPPSHFSIFIVQRGNIIMFMAVGIVPGVGIVPAPMPAVLIPGIPIPNRSIIIAPNMVSLLEAQVSGSLAGRFHSRP
ncbi:MAG: hypothetical protein ACM35G_05620 [Planctomycetaceae bacterium]